MKSPKQDDHRLALQQRLLSATMEVALENGFGKVTMDAVAAKADVSKGGLLYHFATKDDLIRALLECSRKCASSESDPKSIDPFAVALLIAAAENPRLLEPVANSLGVAEGCKAAATELMTRLASRMKTAAD